MENKVRCKLSLSHGTYTANVRLRFALLRGEFMYKEISTEDRSATEAMSKMKKAIIEAALDFLREEKFLNLNVFSTFYQPASDTNVWIVFYAHDLLFVRSEISKVQARFS